MKVIISKMSGLLSGRRRQITLETRDLQAKLRSLATEEKELAIAEAVLVRLGRTRKQAEIDPVA